MMLMVMPTRIISMGVAHRSGILPFQGGTTHHTLRALKELYKHFARNRIVSTFGIETIGLQSRSLPCTKDYRPSTND